MTFQYDYIDRGMYTAYFGENVIGDNPYLVDDDGVPYLQLQKIPLEEKSRFLGSYKELAKQDPLIKFALQFAGRRGIYKYIDYLGISITWQQRQLVDAYARGDSRIACRSGKGPGKTFISAVILTHWVLVHPMSMLIVTAPTFRQCKEGWLSRAEKIITGTEAHPYFRELFDFRGTGFGILGHKNAMWGCQLVTARNKESFQGIHEDYLAIFEDESSGVPLEISEAASETIKNADGMFLHMKIGNPNTRLCKFFDCFNKDAHMWTCLHWNSEETPESMYFSQERNREIADEFGIGSDIYRIAVLGEFPSVDPNCVISEDDINKCMTEEALRTALRVGDPYKKRIAIDLARYGGDENAITTGCGNIIYDMWAQKCGPLTALDRAIVNQEFYGWTDEETLYVIDTSGMGEVAVDEMGGSQRRNKRVQEFYSQNSAMESEKFDDAITECWFTLAKALRKGEVYLGTTITNRLRQQLTTRRYKVTPKGKIKVESKDDYMKQFKDMENGTIGQSPDQADSLVMYFNPNEDASGRVVAA